MYKNDFGLRLGFEIVLIFKCSHPFTAYKAHHDQELAHEKATEMPHGAPSLRFLHKQAKFPSLLGL